MATPTFQEYVTLARQHGVDASLSDIRDHYTSKYGESQEAWEGPGRDQYHSLAKQYMGDAYDEDKVDRHYSNNYSRSALGELWTGLKRGTNMLGAAVGTTMDMMGIDYGQRVEDYWMDRAAKNRRSPAAIDDVWNDPMGALTNPDFMAAGIGEIFPSIGPTIAVGAATHGAGLPAWASMMGMGVTGGHLEAVDKYREHRGRDDQLENYLQNLAGVGALNAIPGGAYFGKFGLPAKVLGGATSEMLTEWAEEPYMAWTEGGDVMQALKEGANVAPFAFLMGAGGGYVGHKMDQAAYNASPEGRFKNLVTDPNTQFSPAGVNGWPVGTSVPLPAMPGQDNFIGPTQPPAAPRMTREEAIERQKEFLWQEHEAQPPKYTDQPRDAQTAIEQNLASLQAEQKYTNKTGTPMEHAFADATGTKIQSPVANYGGDWKAQVVNNIDPNLSQREKAIELNHMGQENRPIIQDLMKRIDERFPGSRSGDNFKTIDNIITKANRPSIKAEKPWHDVEHIRDAYRFKTSMNSMADLPGIVEELNRSGIKIVKADTEKLMNPGPWGWRITSFDLRMPNGQIVEYYLPVKELEAAKKGGGHQLFENWRNYDHTKMTPSQLEGMRQDLLKSQKLYGHSWNRYLRRTHQTAAEVEASLNKALALSGSTEENLLKTSTGNSNFGVQTPSTRENALPPGARTTTSPRSDSATTKPSSNDIGITSNSIVPGVAQDVSQYSANTPIQGFINDLKSNSHPHPFGRGFIIMNRPLRSGDHFAIIELYKDGNYDNALHIESIQTSEHGHGNGAYALRQLVEMADKNGVTLTLYPKKFGNVPGALSTPQLKAWYGRYGFKSTRETGAGMIREPGAVIAPKANEEVAEYGQEPIPVIPGKDRAKIINGMAGKYQIGGILVNQDGSYRRNDKGDISGAPAGVKDSADIDHIAGNFQVYLDHKLANAKQSHPWYRNSGLAIRRLSNADPVVMEQVVRLAAYFSQANSVGGNTTALISSLTQYAQGNEEIFAGRFPNKTNKIIRGLLEADHFDPSVPGVEDKIMSFYRNLHDEAFQENRWPNDVTIDRWMYRVMGFDENQEGGGPARYRFGTEVMRRVTDQYNQKHGTDYLPREIQAILWTYMKNSESAAMALVQGKKYEMGPSLDFNTYLGRATAHVPFETMPADNSDVFQWILGAPIDVKNRYHQEAVQAITGPNGEDLLLAMTKAALHTNYVSRGTFMGDQSPNTVADIVVDKTQKQHQYDTANLYALAMQYIYTQKGVGWFRIDPTVSGGTPTLVVEFDQVPTPEMIDALTKATGQDLTVLGNAATFIDFGGLGMRNFKQVISDGLQNYQYGANIKATYHTKSESDYHGDHDWTADPEGQEILRELASRGSPDLVEWVRGRRRAVEEIQQDFTQRQGEGKLREDLSPSEQAVNKPLQMSLFQDLEDAQRRQLSDDPDIALAQTTGESLLTSINAEARQKGGYSIIGKVVQSPEDLATLGQVWRDPRWETLRYVFVKDGRVVGQFGLSQRLPGETAAFPTAMSTEQGAMWLEDRMNALGADGLWLTHNHPSGHAAPSDADLIFTARLEALLPGKILGHVIIDSNQFGAIYTDAGGYRRIDSTWDVFDMEFHKGPDPLLQTFGPRSDMQGVIANGPAEMADVAESLNKTEGRMQLVGLNPDMTVGAIREIDHNALDSNNIEQLIYGFAKETGSIRTALVNTPWFAESQAVFDPVYRTLIEAGYLLDIIDQGGVSYRTENYVQPRLDFVYGVAGQNNVESVEEKIQQFKRADDKYAGNINKSKFRHSGTPGVLQAAYDSNPQAFTKETRGRVSWEQTESLAQDLGMTVQDLKKRRRGRAFNAHELDRARALVEQSAQEVMNAVKTGNKEQILKALAAQVEIQAKYAGAVAEAGRALQILRKQSLELKEVNRISNDVFRGDPDRAVEMLQEFEHTGQVSKFARDLFKPGVSDVLLEIWINALLSGPQTHAVNITSNALVQAFSVVEDAMASAGGMFRVQDRVTMRDTLARAQGLLRGTVDAANAGARAFMTEEPQDPETKLETDRRAIRAETFGLDPKAAAGKMVNAIGRFVRIPGRALMAMDDVYKTMSKRGTIAQLATRYAIDRGFKGQALTQEIARLVQNPTDDMLKKARDTAGYTTFTNPLGAFGSGIQNLVAKAPVLRLVAPFIRTPTNILKFAIHRSPLAPIFADTRADLMGKNGKATRDVAWARVIMGTGIGYLIAQKAMEGLVSGGGPDDKTKKAMKYAQGWQPYSVYHDGKWYSYARLEPFGMLFGVSADFVEIVDQMSNDEVDNVLGLIVGSIAKNLTSKTWLRGVSEFIQMTADPDRYGSQYVQKLAGTVIPTGVAQVARTDDPALREARTIIDGIKARIPGQREQLFPRRDHFGNPITTEGGVGPDILSPVYTSRVKNDPVAKEVEELGVSWGKPRRDIKGVELTDEQYDQYATISGKYARNLLDAVVRNPGYQRLPAWARKEHLEKIIRKARQQAQAAFIMQHPDILTESYNQKLEQMRN